MKNLLLIPAFFYCQTMFAQSPGLTIHFNVDSTKADGRDLKIEMKFCEPYKRTPSKNYFTRDSSTIDFKKLTDKDIRCESYINNYDSSAYHYYFSNQVFAWEKLIIWKLSATFPKEPMYVILPVKIKSFVTLIEINHVVFQPGRFIWIDEEGKTGSENGQKFLFSLKNRQGIDTGKCSLKPILD